MNQRRPHNILTETGTIPEYSLAINSTNIANNLISDSGITICRISSRRSDSNADKDVDDLCAIKTDQLRLSSGVLDKDLYVANGLYSRSNTLMNCSRYVICSPSQHNNLNTFRRAAVGIGAHSRVVEHPDSPHPWHIEHCC